jgi:hypothetical protein
MKTHGIGSVEVRAFAAHILAGFEDEEWVEEENKRHRGISTSYWLNNNSPLIVTADRRKADLIHLR